LEQGREEIIVYSFEDIIFYFIKHTRKRTHHFGVERVAWVNGNISSGEIPRVETKAKRWQKTLIQIQGDTLTALSRVAAFLQSYAM